MDLPPPTSNAPPAPTPPGAGSIASGITPVRYGAPTPGSARLIASVPVLPPKAGAHGGPAGRRIGSVPGPRSDDTGRGKGDAIHPARAHAAGTGPEAGPGPNSDGRGSEQPRRRAAAAPRHGAIGGQARAIPPVVPITPFGATPPPQPPAPAPEPITFTVRLPTIVMVEPKP